MTIAGGKMLARPSLPAMWGAARDAPAHRSRLPVSLVAVSAATGVLVAAAAYTAGRLGYAASPWADRAYWLGQAFILVPSAARLLSRRALSAAGTATVIVVLTVAEYLVKVCYSPAGFSFPDELEHWRSTTDVLQTGMLGVFMSLDFFLFYVFWEVMLVPMYFIIGVWGGPRKLYAAIKFFLYTLAGSVLMLLGILTLYFRYHTDTGVYTFNYLDLMKHAHSWPLTMQIWVFIAFAIGFAIKVPMFPFHTWLPDAHVEAPTAGSVILAGVLLKMGTYGFIRFSLPLLPQASADPTVVKWMVYLSIIAIIYGALVSMMQKDMKKLIAYSSVSHLGFCTLGIFALNPHGLSGSIIQQINHGISTGALFLIVGLIYERRHTREIKEFGGLSNVMPVYATLFMIVMLSSIGLPLLNGFIGEFTILQGAFEANWHWAAWAVAGIVLGAAYMLWLYQRTMFGACENPKNQVLKDLNLREIMTLVPLIVWAFWIGLYPKPFFKILEKPVNAIVMQVNPGFYPPAKAAPAEISVGEGAPLKSAEPLPILQMLANEKKEKKH